MNDVAVAARSANTTVLTPIGVRTAGRVRQNYVPVRNEPGELMVIDKQRLRVDQRYQRRLDALRVARIVANWSWISCGTLSVARRADGVFFVFDGQHRLEAARKLPKVVMLPCLVFELADDIKDEAIGFLAANVERKLPNLTDQFKALLIAEDRHALVAQRLVTEAGRTVKQPASGTTVSCVSEMLRAIYTDQRAFERIWPTITTMCKDKPIPARIIKGMMGIERRIQPKASLAIPRWHSRLVHVGPENILETIKQVVQLERNTSEKSCAQGVAHAINRNLRQPLKVNFDRPLPSASRPPVAA